jgi:hypothetical protein
MYYIYLPFTGRNIQTESQKEVEVVLEQGLEGLLWQKYSDTGHCWVTSSDSMTA